MKHKHNLDPDFPSVSPVPECTVTLPGDGEQGVQSGNTENLSSRSIDDSQGVTGSIFSWRRAYISFNHA